MNIWFTSDTHFDHTNILKYCNRPFDTVEEMNEAIISNWNSVVTNDDVVYHLGDFCFGKPLQFIHRLNGYIIIIPGSHDKEITVDGEGGLMRRRFIYPNITEIKVDISGTSKLIVLCHYAMRSWNKSHYGSWHLYGHHHGKLPPCGLSFDVGVDTNNFYPYSLDDVKKKMDTLTTIVDYSKPT